MAEYHRILSYLYRYDKKKKIDCKGFVKAEQKRNGLKITLQIDDEHLIEEIKLSLCFYDKTESGWRIHPVEMLESSNHHEETVLFYPAERLPDDFDIQKEYGILLFYQEFFYYGSVWIGDEIPIDDLLTKMEPSQNMEHNMEKAIEDKDSEQPSKEGKEVEEKKEIEKIEAENTAEEVLSEKEQEEELVDDTSVEEAPVFFEEKIELPEEKDLLKNMWVETNQEIKPVDNIFNPAFRNGYQISVDQLGNFSSEAERLAENQFLIKGYTLYHHLLAGKVMYAGEERYCVGVPGIYENRERYMAQLYQFPIFLSLTENRIKTGGFGYWLHLLQE